jgi:hypothetical protein
MIDIHDMLDIEGVIANAAVEISNKLRTQLKPAFRLKDCDINDNHGSYTACVGTLKVNIEALRAMLNRVEKEIGNS